MRLNRESRKKNYFVIYFLFYCSPPRYLRTINGLLICIETIKLYCRGILMKWFVFNLLLSYLFWCREFGNIITPCCLTAFKNVLCRTNSLILWVLLMLNSGAEPKDILTAKINEENYFPYYLGRTFVHDSFKITFHFQWGLCDFFSHLSDHLDANLSLLNFVLNKPKKQNLSKFVITLFLWRVPMCWTLPGWVFII